MREMIYKRKSVRWYRPEPLSRSVLADILNKIDETEPLFEGTNYSIELIATPSGRKGSAPHHLIFCGNDDESTLANIGYLGQRISLYMSSIGVGSFWKMGKPSEVNEITSSLPVVITMAFGSPMEPPLSRTQRIQTQEFIRNFRRIRFQTGRRPTGPQRHERAGLVLCRPGGPHPLLPQKARHAGSRNEAHHQLYRHGHRDLSHRCQE